MFHLLLYLMVGLVLGAREEDKVDYLPGLDPQPDFDHYAGFLDVDGNKKFFYWFVESENDPANDPLVLWLNGGPGCSSLTGFFVELGPWRTNPDGETLSWFEHRWNKIANMIFMESPQCVGYSYAEDGNCTSGDDQSAYDNHMALLDFFEGFPEYRDHDFYVTGESYAGVYVPLLSQLVADDPTINFKGFAVGNPVTDNVMMDNGLINMMWARGFYGTDLWNDLLDNCCEDRNATECDFASADNTLACRALWGRVMVIAWASGLNPYHMYDECYGGAPMPNISMIMDDFDGKTPIRAPFPGSFPIIGQENRDVYLEFFRDMMREFPTLLESTIPCTDTSDRETYLNNPEVREAINVPEFVQDWYACSNEVGFSYDRQYPTMEQVYRDMIESGEDYNILVFNGDLDLACNSLGNLWFVEKLQYPMTYEYTSWLYDDEVGTQQIGGYAAQFEGVRYVQVLAAGHFVPTDRPYPAYVMWEKYLNNEDYMPLGK